MPRTARSMVRTGVAVVAVVVLLSLAAPATPAKAQPALCNGGANHYTIWTSLAANKYVTAEFGYGGNLWGMVRAANDYAGAWETWTICSWWEGATKVSFIKNEHNDRYVSAELKYTGADQGMLRARATSVNAWEKFRIDRWGPNPNMYTIRSNVNGKYVSTEMHYTGARHAMLRARATHERRELGEVHNPLRRSLPMQLLT